MFVFNCLFVLFIGVAGCFLVCLVGVGGCCFDLLGCLFFGIRVMVFGLIAVVCLYCLISLFVILCFMCV